MSTDTTPSTTPSTTPGTTTGTTSGTGPAAGRPITLAKALNAALRRSMEADSKVVVMGEDVGRLGGVFRIT
ncbi:MAG: hypothetical protein L0H31_02075, partial [Nocardioidaceae bacterium]|nr:hypothetical protein [Nocardioidaceae bacterium]